MNGDSQGMKQFAERVDDDTGSYSRSLECSQVSAEKEAKKAENKK